MDCEPLDELVDDAYVVDPGDHSFTFSTQGHGAVSKQLSIRAGEKGRRESVPFAAPAPALSSTSGDLLRDLGYVSVGAGALGLTMGTVFGIVAKTTYDDAQTHCHASDCDLAGVDGGRRAHTFASVSTVGFVGGAVLLAGGIALLLLEPRSPAAALGRNAVLLW